MSVHVSSWVWKHAPAAGNRLLVLLALADIANDDGIAWPSMTYLADKTRLSLSTVKRVMADLKTEGVLVADVSLGRSSVYRIVTLDQGHSDTTQGHSDLAQLDPGHSEPGSPVTQGEGQSDPGGRSTVTLYTSDTHQDTSLVVVDDSEIPKGTSKPTAFPNEFYITKEMREWAAKTVPLVDLRIATLEFVAYWREGEGKGLKKKNWVMTWQRRLRDLQKWAEEAAPKNPAGVNYDDPALWGGGAR